MNIFLEKRRKTRKVYYKKKKLIDAKQVQTLIAYCTKSIFPHALFDWRSTEAVRRRVQPFN